jgi:hypothetical protein
MFCDQCGAALQTGQSFCSTCGKQVVGSVSWNQPRPGRVQSHTRLLGILWLAISAFHVIGGVVLLVIANTIFGRFHDFEGPAQHAPSFLHPLLTCIAILVLAKAAFGFFAGWGLLQSAAWGRTMALVLGFVALFSVPIGTALGIYTLWVLLPAESEREYARQVEMREHAV